MHHRRVRFWLPAEEKPDLQYDLSGRQGLLNKLVLCGQRPCAERLAATSSLWKLAYTLMILTASLHVLQVKEESEAYQLEPALCISHLKDPLYILSPYLHAAFHRYCARRAG